MKKLIYFISTVVGAIITCSVAFAETAAGSGEVTSTGGLVALGSGLCMGIAAFGAATAQGRTAMAAVEGIARNPQSNKQVFLPFILGLAFMEFQALLGFIIAFLWYAK